MSAAAVEQEVAAAFRDELLRLVRRRLNSDADVDDVVQDVMLRLLRAPDRIPNEEDTTAWLRRVVANASVDHYRRKASRARAMERFSSETLVQASAERASEDETREDLARCVRPLLALLSPDDQQALELTDLGGRSQRDVAAELGIGQSAMKSRVQRARKRLHAAFVDCCDADCEGKSC